MTETETETTTAPQVWPMEGSLHSLLVLLPHHYIDRGESWDQEFHFWTPDENLWDIPTLGIPQQDDAAVRVRRVTQYGPRHAQANLWWWLQGTARWTLVPALERAGVIVVLGDWAEPYPLSSVYSTIDYQFDTGRAHAGRHETATVWGRKYPL